MMTTKFTPGPWRVRTGDMDGDPDVFAPFGACGCCDSPWMNGETKAQEVANARLIEAAPYMYNALTALLAHTNNIEVLGEWSAANINRTSSKKLRAEVDAAIAQSRAALALARGE